MASHSADAGQRRSRFDALAEELARSVPDRLRATEWAAGYGVLGVEFESGDVLALRHFPYGALDPYATVWHRSPDGFWRMYFDAQSPNLACPRYFGDALFDTERATVELHWLNDDTLDVRASKRHLAAVEPMRVRVGLNAGEPIAEDGDLFGSTVILASRIAAQARAEEILIAEPLRHLLSGKSYVYADRGETVLKGFEDAMRLYEVRWRE
jgi:hypothetical protein